RVGERMSSRARHVAMILAGAALIYLTAQFSIELPDNPVPVTGQTLGVLLVGGALGSRRGFLATLLYLAIGVIGYPAFALHKGGPCGGTLPVRLVVRGAAARRALADHRERRPELRPRPP